MKVPRASVEWGFKDMKQVCSSLDVLRKMNVREAPDGLLYRIGALVCNLRCCKYGSATYTFFKCTPPSVEDYLRSGGHVPGEDDSVVGRVASGWHGNCRRFAGARCSYCAPTLLHSPPTHGGALAAAALSLLLPLPNPTPKHWRGGVGGGSGDGGGTSWHSHGSTRGGDSRLSASRRVAASGLRRTGSLGW